jgi:CBS domain-containing protein
MTDAAPSSVLVRNLMTANVVTAREADDLERVARLMWDEDLGFLPVVTGGGQLIGVITDRDICMAAYTRGTSLKGTSVTSAMARAPVTCTIHDDARAVEQRMASHRLRRLPVVDGCVVVGVVTLADIARASLRGHDLSSRGPTWTLAAITQPRRLRAGT